MHHPMILSLLNLIAGDDDVSYDIRNKDAASRDKLAKHSADDAPTSATGKSRRSEN